MGSLCICFLHVGAGHSTLRVCRRYHRPCHRTRRSTDLSQFGRSKPSTLYLVVHLDVHLLEIWHFLVATDMAVEAAIAWYACTSSVGLHFHSCCLCYSCMSRWFCLPFLVGGFGRFAWVDTFSFMIESDDEDRFVRFVNSFMTFNSFLPYLEILSKSEQDLGPDESVMGHFNLAADVYSLGSVFAIWATELQLWCHWPQLIHSFFYGMKT